MLGVYTFVYTGIVRIVRASVTWRGIQHGAGRPASHLGRGDLRNVVVPERVPVKLHIDHLEELQLIATEVWGRRVAAAKQCGCLLLTVSAPSVCSPVYVLSSCGKIMQRSKCNHCSIYVMM